MPASAPVAHGGFEVIRKMTTPQMIAMDQVLAEFELPQTDPAAFRTACRSPGCICCGSS
jgi:hypothetical protein